MRAPTPCIIPLALLASAALFSTASIIRPHDHETPLCKPCSDAYFNGQPVTGLCNKTPQGDVECLCAEGAVHPDPQHLQICKQHPCYWPATPVCDATTSTCVATKGLGYRCDCHTGFAPLRSSHGKLCVPKIDHCSLGTDTCDRTKSECVYKSPDQYHCKAKHNPKALMKAADTATNPCDELSDTCDRTSTQCVTTAQGKFECQCLTGYKRDPNSGNANFCIPYNLCTAGEHRCDTKSTQCVPKTGGYSCRCKSGFQVKDAYTCTEIHVCSTEDNKCDTKTTECVDTGPGKFACQCLTGYERTADSTDIYSCTEIDLCKSTTTNKCDAATTICNFQGLGTYTCECAKGFKRKDQYTCVLNDPCKDNTHQCDLTTTTCEFNFPDDYRCVCKEGFERKTDDLAHKNYCTDIDECADTLNPPCNSTTSTCRNTLGSYECDCLPGYRQPTEQEMTDTTKNTNQVCIDIDECTELPENPCQAIFEKETKANLLPVSVIGGDGCTNLPGSYSCTCADGFDHGDNDDPTQCSDINECTQDIDECDQKSTYCKNTRGSYNCPCQWGYKPTQEPPTTSTTESVSHNSIQRSATVAGGFSCEDIDECKEGLQGDPQNTVCDPERSLCSNTVGGYACKCYEGFYPADKAVLDDLLRNGCKSTKTPCCIDIDECNEKETTIHECTDICLSGLVEFPLNYTCDCNDKRYFLDDKKRRCDNCGYEDWGSWGPCSVTCGSGVYTRTRKIKEGLGDTSPLCAKPEYTVMTKVCVMPPCDDERECRMSGWSEWTPCTLINGKPIQTRFRFDHCDNNSLEESQPCSLDEEEAPLEISWTHIGLACGGVTVVLGTLASCAYYIHQRRNAPVYIY